MSINFKRMKKIYTFLLTIGVVTSLMAQSEFPIEFESSAELANWEVFENGENAPEHFTIVANEDYEGINNSDSCLQFIVAADGQPWAGAFSKAYGDIEITEDNHVFSMMVKKDILTRCLIKLEISQEEFAEVFAENTFEGEWEELVFDFSDYIGNTYPTLVIFPDYPEGMAWGERTDSVTTLIDNFGWYSPSVGVSSLKAKQLVAFPNPTMDALTINYDGISDYKIFNITGQLVAENKFDAQNEKTIDVSFLPNGIYNISVNNNTMNAKFVKM